ncbi:CDP-diacylglycerol--glycerol-3-phosphate 3-phosphatidyltransferase [Spirochaetia bacterium]|nr:CDP-diacylglycerol--glycerol-3-phosphate 3-phosphatidyltransferase [Spirochaetia bacterium]
MSLAAYVCLDSPQPISHTQPMTSADKITSVRLILAPVFFVIYLLPVLVLPLGFSQSWLAGQWTVPVLWALFIISEITDLVDGRVARRQNTVGDFGKLYDPFADVLVRITYFLCFVIDGILPVILFLLVLYREFGIQFLRVLMMRKGVAMGARWGGKIKAVTYMVAGAFALLASSVRRLGIEGPWFTVFHAVAVGIFAISVVIALVSFADYLVLYRKTEQKAKFEQK